MNSLTWQSGDGGAYQFVGGAVNASIDLTRLSDGLTIRLPASNPFGQLDHASTADAGSMHVLGIRVSEARGLEAARADGYVRGSDFVATYEGAAPRRLRLQAYWRAMAPVDVAPEFATEILAAFDLIVSVNTSLLDDDPRSAACSKILRASDVSEVEPGAFAVRFGDANYCWLEMIHPSDDCQSVVETLSRDGVEIRHELFRRRLEKGVILRARVRGALVRNTLATEIATTAYERFASAEPPLTV